MTSSEQSQIARIRRRLLKDGLLLRSNRRSDQPDLGQFYIVDSSTNTVVEKNIDLNELENRLRHNQPNTTDEAPVFRPAQIRWTQRNGIPSPKRPDRTSNFPR